MSFAIRLYQPPPLPYDAAMNMLGDWKWHAALAVFVVFTFFIIWLPGPQAKPAAESAVTTTTVNPADLAPRRPAPTPDQLESMLHYTVQDDDTVASIARLFVVPEEEIRWANRIIEGGEVIAGDKIRVPAP